MLPVGSELTYLPCCRERNEAVSRLGEGMKELERLEADRREMISKIDLLTRDNSQR